MRRLLRRHLPDLSLYFGIHPWHLDDMTFGEVTAYMDALAALRNTKEE